MARTRVRYRFVDDAGNKQVHIKVTAYVPGTNTLVSGAWDAASGGSAIAWPLAANSKGYATFYLDTAQDVELAVTDDTNFLLHAADDRPYVSVAAADLSGAYAPIASAALTGNPTLNGTALGFTPTPMTPAAALNPFGVKYRGVTMTPQWDKVAGGAGWVDWGVLWTTAFSATAIDLALTDIVNLGANLVTAYSSPGKVLDGTATRATWLANQKTFLDKALAKNLSVYFTLGDKCYTSNITAVVAELVELAKLLSGYPNVIAINLGNEMNAFGAPTVLQFTTFINALWTAVRPVTSKPMGCNIEYTATPGGSPDAYTQAVMALNPDFVDIHVYKGSGVGPTVGDVAQIHAWYPATPIIIGEACDALGANNATNATIINNLRKIVELPYVVGAVVFPSHDYTSTGVPAGQGLINSATGLERTVSTYPFRTIPRRSLYPCQNFPLSTGALALASALTDVAGAQFPLMTSAYDASQNGDPMYRVTAVAGNGLGVGDTVEVAVVDAGTSTTLASGTAVVAGTGSTTTPDSGPNTYAATVAGGTLVGTSPWSGFGSAISLPGTAGQGIILPSTLGLSGAFSFEAKIKRSAIGVAQVIVSKWYGTTNNFIFGINASNQLYLYIQTAAGNFFQNTTFTIADTAVHDVAFCVGNGGNVYLFRDGVLLATYSITGITAPDTTTPLWIGGASSGSTGYFAGTIDEVRISNTFRYTATYTPATTPFTSDANTIALLHCDSIDVATTNNLVKVSTPWTYVPAATVRAKLQVRNQSGVRGSLYSAVQEVRYA